MRLQTALTLTAALFAAACSAKPVAAPAPAAPAPAAAPAQAAARQASAADVDPVGRWSLALVAQGQPLDFELELRHVSGDDYAGLFKSDFFPPMPTTYAKRAGNAMILRIIAPTGDEATINIAFEDDTFSGEWSMPGDGSRVSGRRIAQ